MEEEEEEEEAAQRATPEDSRAGQSNRETYAL